MNYIFWGSWILAGLLISYRDFRTHEIRNEDIAILAVLLISFPRHQIGWSEKHMVLNEIAGALFNFLIFYLLYLLSLKKLGGGDVKLAIPIGIFLGSFPNGELFVAATTAFLLATFYALIRVSISTIKFLNSKIEGKQLSLKSPVPLAPFLFLGASLSLMI